MAVHRLSDPAYLGRMFKRSKHSVRVVFQGQETWCDREAYSARFRDLFARVKGESDVLVGAAGAFPGIRYDLPIEVDGEEQRVAEAVLVEEGALIVIALKSAPAP